MRFDQIFFWMFVIILAGVVLRNWQGANNLLRTTFGGTNTLVTTLEQR